MWRSAFTVFLLAGSPVLAGEARGTIQVGITITGNAAHAPAKRSVTGSGEQAAAIGGNGAMEKPRVRSQSRTSR
jgi:hypothetical protein